MNDFRFPHDVIGWLSELEGRALAHLAQGKDVLEIGAYQGRSTICLAQTANSVTTVDPCDGRATNKTGDNLAILKKNLQRYDVRADIFVGTSAEWCTKCASVNLVYDLIFIDGAHDYDSVQTDVRLSLPLLRPGGLLAFHDYRIHPGEVDSGWDPGVTKTVQELIEAGAKLLSRHGTVAVVDPSGVKP